MPPSDSGLYFATLSKASVSGSSGNASDNSQTSLSPRVSALPTIGEAEPEVEARAEEVKVEKSWPSIEMSSSLQIPEGASAENTELTPQAEHRDPLQTFAARQPSSEAFTKALNHQVNTTPRKYTTTFNTVEETLLPLANAGGGSGTSCISRIKTEFNVEEGQQPELIACDTCQSVDQLFTRTRMSPCQVSLAQTRNGMGVH